MTLLQALRAIRPTVARQARGHTSLSSSYLCDQLLRIGAPEHRPHLVEQLSGCFGYPEWVAKFYPETYKRMCSLESATRRPFQEGRLQWLDHMISQEESK